MNSLRTPHPFLAAAAALLAALMVPAAARAQASVDVSVSPTTVRLGDFTRMSISVRNGSQVRVAMPEVDGLEFTQMGQSRKDAFVNGQHTAMAEYYIGVTPQRQGTFTIPSFIIEVDGQQFRSLPEKLTVTAGTAPPSTGSTRQRQIIQSLPTPNQMLGIPDPTRNPQPQQAPQQAPAGQSASTPPTAVPADAGPVFMTMEVPGGREVYVGQMVPVTFRIFVHADLLRSVNLQSLPTLDNQAFTVNAMEPKPDQRDEPINGENYRMLTWNTGITPVKAGTYNLQATVEMEMPDLSQRRRGAFGDPFMAVFGGLRMVQRTIATDSAMWTVLELPTEGRPASFDGAIGSFEVTADATPKTVEVGEPLTVSSVVSGQGNFARVTAPRLSDEQGWKTYPAKAEVQLSGPSGTEGRKTFEQAVIPREDSITKLPPLVFSFFDPAKKAYVTRNVEIPGVTVTGAGTTPKPAVQPVATEPAVAPKANAPGSNLVPNQLELTPFHMGFIPVYVQPWFMAVNAVTLLILAAGYVTHRRQERLANDPALAAAREHQRAVRVELDQMAKAQAAGDNAAFFTAARRALQQALARKWKLRPDDISLAAIQARHTELAESVAPVYAMADEAAYGGQIATQVALADWDKSVRDQLRYIESNL